MIRLSFPSGSSVRALSATRFAICCTGLAASTAGAEAKWYVGAGTAITLHSGMEQVGWNSDAVCYAADYRDTSPAPPAYDPPLSFYGSDQDVDRADTVRRRLGL